MFINAIILTNPRKQQEERRNHLSMIISIVKGLISKMLVAGKGLIGMLLKELIKE